jgi:hypothetical protein
MAMCTGENSVHLLMVRLKVKREKEKCMDMDRITCNYLLLVTCYLLSPIETMLFTT